jgi:hypothetical protein
MIDGAAGSGARPGTQIDMAAFFHGIGYEPHAPQWEFHRSDARFRVAVCGRRFGKSTMAARDLEPHLFLPDRLFWIVGPTYDLGEKEFRVIWDDLMVRKGLIKNKKVKKAYNKKQGNMFIEFPWGTRVEVRSADHPENLVGDALDGVIISEAAKQKVETWQRFLRPALSDKRGFATFPTTPEGYNWIHKLYQMGKDPKFPNWASWRMPSWANTVVYPGGRNDPEILEIEQSTIPDWFDQEIGALFSAFVGKIYGEWDEESHVQVVEYDPMLPNYVAFDWGFTNPMAAIEFQVTPRDEVRIWREHYKAYTTLNDFLKEMQARTQPEGYHITLCFGDAADPDAISTVNKDFAPCIGDPLAKDNWRQGVMNVKKYLLRDTGLLDAVGKPIKKPALHVDHSCKWTIHEFNNYKTPKPVSGKNVPEMGQKVEDHALDAIRYGLMHVFVLGCQYHLEDVIDLSSAASLATVDSVTEAAPEGGIFTMSGQF